MVAPIPPIKDPFPPSFGAGGGARGAADTSKSNQQSYKKKEKSHLILDIGLIKVARGSRRPI